MERRASEDGLLAVHYTLGKAYAIDLLDLIHANQEDGGDLNPRAFACIAIDILRKAHTMSSDGVYDGFFGTISEYLVTGTVDR